MDAHKQPTTKQPASAPATPRGVRAAAWGVRGAFALVFAVNVQCALAFVAQPAAYAPAYELSGAAGTAAVQGIGVAFLMWNATYPAVIAQPRRFRSLAVVVLVQRANRACARDCPSATTCSQRTSNASSPSTRSASRSWPPRSSGCSPPSGGASGSGSSSDTTARAGSRATGTTPTAPHRQGRRGRRSRQRRPILSRVNAELDL